MITTTRALPVLLTALSALLGACSSTPMAPPAAPKPPAPTAAAAPAPVAAPAPRAAAANPAPASTVTAVTLPAYLDPKNPIATERSVYFDYDAFVIKADYKGVVERQGQFLSANPKVTVKIEGNADERGSAEYNLALGQKRAEAVRQALKIYGVKDGQMEAVSWGSEKPKAAGHDEAAWAQNRRVDVQYPVR